MSKLLGKVDERCRQAEKEIDMARNFPGDFMTSVENWMRHNVEILDTTGHLRDEAGLIWCTAVQVYVKSLYEDLMLWNEIQEILTRLEEMQSQLESSEALDERPSDAYIQGAADLYFTILDLEKILIRRLRIVLPGSPAMQDLFHRGSCCLAPTLVHYLPNDSSSCLSSIFEASVASCVRLPLVDLE